MASPFSVSVLTLVLLIGVTSACNLEKLASIQFGYSGAKGPDSWGSLNPHFAACASGKHQSPVNILKNETVTNGNLKPLTRAYKSANATLVNNGFNIGIRYDQNVGVLLVDGKNYTLKQMHWHCPSEHRINGEQFAAELHMVHLDNDGNFAVVGILYSYGNADPFISKLKAALDKLAKERCGSDEEAHVALGTININHIRKNSRKYYRYMGSLTTPPCSEKVVWNILGKVRTISKEQVEALTVPLDSVCKKNARPPQQLNGRMVELYDEMGDD
ncbi:putative Alpha carbonic anhydrase 1 [Tripterygium wilfordii]|uniref:Carbonic anhydrase n=1 Tax=Tripterygium wilfordii TaxID=458696 RepID=A0A7J7DWP0_TRIWF|nr:alpha carbonic anhydrase 1, chloroplastic-like [Tripterygium wilfordii]KAF5750516.1 putative Alpha carbonic anhydrase 1 [Tripterygium wilfordii]